MGDLAHARQIWPRLLSAGRLAQQRVAGCGAIGREKTLRSSNDAFSNYRLVY
jgi:hypothetical protein